jgi:hypothetical protein
MRKIMETEELTNMDYPQGKSEIIEEVRRTKSGFQPGMYEGISAGQAQLQVGTNAKSNIRGGGYASSTSNAPYRLPGRSLRGASK